jgi:hypothetical protein
MVRKVRKQILPFPVGGLNTNQSFEDQPQGTSWNVQNVRAYDPGSGRSRGGQRAGTVKYVDDRTANDQVQDMGQIVTRAVPSAQTTMNVRSVVNYAVTGGTVEKFDSTAFTLATSGTTALSATPPVIFSTELFGVVYFADGANEKKWTASTNTVAAWTPSAGTLPDGGGGEKPRLIETWRSRIVCSGVENDPHNWFMSKVGDALDWDYAPTTQTVVQAVAGNNAEAGKDADIINGLIPYNDDILIFLGDHSIHQMTGDPAEGGRIDLITDQVGGAWGRAWCKDPSGAIYFFGSRGGVYRMVPGTPPESLSLGSIEEDLSTIDLDTHIVRMNWDDRTKGFHLFLTDLTPVASTHYYYDARNQSWWRDVFATTTSNPTATLTFDGDASDDRVILLGCLDGYIRNFDLSADDDDGTAISSHVWLGPISYNSLKLMLTELEAKVATGSNDISFEVYYGESAQAAQASTPIVTGDWVAGRNKSERRRATGHSFYVKLYNTTNDEKWAFEQLVATLHTFDGPRGRQW